MSQVIFNTINPAATSGTQLAALLEDFKDAMVSGMSGTSRPTELVAGGMWVDTTNEGSPNFYTSLMYYDGTVDIELIRVNLSTGKPSIAGADSTFEVSRVSADAVGSILSMVKRRIASNGQVLSGDVIGQFKFIGRASDSSNPVVSVMEVVATENYTSTQSGSALVFYATPGTENAAVEVMRVVNRKLGVGTTSPDSSIHALGTTGIKSERNSDDAAGAVISLSKSRIAGTKASQSGDVLGSIDGYTTDDGSNKVLSSQIETSASENHTATARGTTLKIKTSDTGATTPTSKLEIGNKVETVATHRTNSTELVSQNVATAATIAQLSATKSLVEMTGSTLTDIQGINSGHASKVLTIHNRSTAYVNLLHENAGATAADRIKLPSGATVQIPPEGSAELFYCTTDTRWKLKSSAGGSGGGGGGGIDIELFPQDNAPIESLLYNSQVFEFEDAIDSLLYTEFRVPDSYVSGNQINLKGQFFTSAITGNVLFKTVATLIRNGTDASSSTTNQRTSTNSAITVNGTANVDTTFTCDITSATGQINGVGVSAGDRIKVSLTRDTATDTAAASAYLYKKGHEVKLS